MLAVSILLSPLIPTLLRRYQFIIHQIRSPSLRGLLALSLPASLPRSVHTVLRRALTPFWRERRGEEGKGVALSHLANVSLLRDRFFSVKRPNKGRGGRQRGREGGRGIEQTRLNVIWATATDWTAAWRTHSSHRPHQVGM